MSEHQKDTAFLRRIILYDDTNEQFELQKRITQLQRDENCVRRMMSMLLVVAALGIAALAYGAVLEEDFSYREFRFVIRILFDLGAASLICLLALAGLLVIYRMRMNKLREQCRRLIASLMASHLGEPHAAVPQNTHSETGHRRATQDATEANGSADRRDLVWELTANDEGQAFTKPKSIPDGNPAAVTQAHRTGGKS